MRSEIQTEKNPSLIVVTPPGSYAEWDWILSVILKDWLGLSFRREEKADAKYVTLALGQSSSAVEPVVLGAEFWLRQAERNEGYCAPVEPLGSWTPEPQDQRQILVEPQIPVLFGSAPHADIPIDVFGSAFWMLARIEELSPGELDKHGRFPGSRSLAVREGFVDRPIVDEYVAQLRHALSTHFPSLRMRAPVFHVRVSHDVDAPSQFGLGMPMYWTKGVVRQLRKGRNAKGLAIAARRLLKTPQCIEPGDTMNTFDYLMSQSEKRNLKSAFYFFGGRTDPRSDAGYTLAHPAIQSLLQQVHVRGHEIGLHPSYHTYLAPDILAAEARNLVDRCRSLGIKQEHWGGRMHFLRWLWPDTARAWNDANLTYDSTLGFPDRAGFRCGTSHEYSAFDPVERKQMSLRLRPLVVMECTIIAPRYMGLGYSEAAYETVFKLKDRCRKYGGGFSLLWHNSHFTNPEDRALYEAALDR